MASELCASLATHERSGRTIAIKVRLDDWTTVTRARTLEQPTCDAEVVTAQALRLLESYAPARPVRLLGVRVAGLNHPAPTPDTSHASMHEQGAPVQREAAPDRDQLELPV